MNMNMIVLVAAICLPPHQDSFDEFAEDFHVGEHRTLSSSDGFDSFNSTRSRLGFLIESVDQEGNMTGLVTPFGLDWVGQSEDLSEGAPHVLKFTGAINKNNVVFSYIKEGTERDGRTYRSTTTAYGYFEDGAISGYFTNSWEYSDGKAVRYGGTFAIGK